MGKLSTSDAADPAITTSEEDPARLAFEAGSSAFMINYPFVYPSAEGERPGHLQGDEGGQVPGGRRRARPSAPPLGGINLGVSAFSENKDVAFEAIECLVKPENQIAIATSGGLPPVREDLYDSTEIEKVYPGFAQLIRQSIEDAAPRPSESPAYQDISLAIQEAVHPTTDIDPNDPARPTTSCASCSSRRSTGRGCCEQVRRRGAAAPTASAPKDKPKVSDRTQGRAQARAGCCARRR